MDGLRRQRFCRSMMAAGVALVVLATAPGVAAAAGGRPRAALQMTPTQHSYGSVPVGATSAPFTYTVTNAGTARSGPVSWSITGKQAPEFSAVSGGDGACTSGAIALAPGESCTTAVAFAPLPPLGKKSATLTVSDGPGTGSPKASLVGTAVPPASLTLSPTTHDFGQITGGFITPAYAFTVTNVGSAPSGAIAFVPTGTDPSDFFVLSGASNGCVSGTTTLAPGASCTIDVSLAGSEPYGPKSASLQVSSPNAYEGAPSAALSGESIPPDVLSLSPTSHDFGSVAVGSSTTTTFTATNTGLQTTLELHTAISGTDGAEFTIGVSTNHCIGATLDVGESCTFAVTFAPASDGSKSASASVWTAKTASNFNAALTGNTAASGCTVGPNTGCITLSDVVVQKLESQGPPPAYGTPSYTLSGSISFSPTCGAASEGCDYSNYQDYFTGSGTFSLDDGTSVVPGTWTATFYSAGFGPSYQDGSDCAIAAIRTFYGTLSFTDGTNSWQTNFIEIRTDTTADGPYKNMVYMNGLTGPTGLQGNYHTSDMSGATVSC